MMDEQVGHLDSGTGRKYEGKVSKQIIVMLCQLEMLSNKLIGVKL